MRKIPTLFRRDPENMSRVLPEVNPVCQWVADGEGYATRKYDGTCVRLDDAGGWWARREVKPGKTPPAIYLPEETDPRTGKTMGWEPMDQSSFAKAFGEVDRSIYRVTGTYELCGPKVNGNPEGYTSHVLVRHGQDMLYTAPRDFEGLREFLSTFPHEGIVWWNPDGRKAKLKVKDFR